MKLNSVFILVGSAIRLDKCIALGRFARFAGLGRAAISLLLAPQSVVVKDDSGPDRIDHLDESGKWTPFYAITFDKTGTCTSKEKLNHFLKETAKYTDVFIVSHGWNTEEDEAIEQYKIWTQGYVSLKGNASHAYSPVVVGIIWPSKRTLLTPQTTQVQRARKNFMMQATADDNDDSSAIAELVEDCFIDADGKSKRRIAELLKNDFFNPAEISEVTDFLKPLLLAGGILEEEVEQHTENLLQGTSDLLTMFDAMADGTSPQPSMSAFHSEMKSENNIVDAVANFLGLLSFWQMRFRARDVGWKGVNELLRSVLTHNKQSRVHLIGHSFGASVLLSAVAEKELSPLPWPRPVSSMLLLQPAIEHTVFQPDNQQGVFRRVFGRVKAPIVSTLSEKDDALRIAYQYAMLVPVPRWFYRSSFMTLLSTDRDNPGSKYSALGGYLPQNLPPDEWQVVDPVQVGTPQDFGKRALCAVRMHNVIKNHNDIFQRDVYWLLVDMINQAAGTD